MPKQAFSSARTMRQSVGWLLMLAATYAGVNYGPILIKAFHCLLVFILVWGSMIWRGATGKSGAAALLVCDHPGLDVHATGLGAIALALAYIVVTYLLSRHETARHERRALNAISDTFLFRHRRLTT